MTGEPTSEEATWFVVTYEKQTPELMPARVLARLLRLGLMEQKIGGPGISAAGSKWLAKHGHMGRRQPR